MGTNHDLEKYNYSETACHTYLTVDAVAKVK